MIVEVANRPIFNARKMARNNSNNNEKEPTLR